MSRKNLCRLLLAAVITLFETLLPGPDELWRATGPGFPFPGSPPLPLFSRAYGEEISTPVMECQDVFPNLLSDIPWKAMFPIRIGGKTIINAGGLPDNINTGNADDFNPSDYICSCENSRGGTDYGIYLSFWEPARVVEVSLKPNCFSFLFGLDLGDSLNLAGAYGAKGTGGAPGDKAFYNVHLYSFPLMEVMDLLTGADYCTDWFNDIDLIYFTEMDPLWNDDELTAYLNPEAMVFGNPVAQALCPVDCAAASAGYPLNSLFWCAGCWGSLYPYTGNTGVTGSPVRVTSLLAARILARLARLPVPPAMEFDTSGAEAKCGGQIRPLIKKSQYRLSLLFPIPEDGAHSLGASTLTWGEHRNIPATGEFQIYLVWRKRNCCLKIF